MSTSSVDAGFTPVVSQNVFKEVIAQRDDLVQIDGGRMVPPSADSSYPAGQLMAQLSGGANSGLWVPYDTANASATDGSQTPKGVLYGGADPLANGGNTEIRVITAGSVYKDLLVYQVSGVQTSGILAAAITAMGAKSFVIHGQNVLKF